MLFRDLKVGDYFVHKSTYDWGQWEPRKKTALHRKCDINPITLAEFNHRKVDQRGDSEVYRLREVGKDWHVLIGDEWQVA